MATHTVKQSGGDFSTLASALADAGTGAGDTISIEGTWSVNDTAAATVSDASITVTTDSDSKADPTNLASPTHYRLRHSGGSHCLTINGATFIIDGVEIQQAGTGSSDECIREGINDQTNTTTIKNCILWAASFNSDQDGTYKYLSGIVSFENCVFFGFGRSGIQLQYYSSSSTNPCTFNVNSCSVYDCGEDGDATTGGIVLYGQKNGATVTMNVFNTLVLECDYGASAQDYQDYGSNSTRIWDIHNSIDSDNTIAGNDSGAVGCLASRAATDSSSPGAGDWVMLEDITSSPEDLTLQDDSTNNDAQEMHTTASGAGMSMPSTDIMGNTRSSPYDCGAFHVVSGGPAFRPKHSPLHGPFSGPFGGPL